MASKMLFTSVYENYLFPFAFKVNVFINQSPAFAPYFKNFDISVDTILLICFSAMVVSIILLLYALKSILVSTVCTMNLRRKIDYMHRN